MKHLVYYPANLNSKMVAGARIAHWLHAQLPKNKALIDGRAIRDYKESLSDTVFYMVNVPKTMIREVELTEKFVSNAAKVVWIQNDYSIWAPTTKTAGQSIITRAFTHRIVKRKPTFTWSTCWNRCVDNPVDYRYINWNALAHAPFDPPRKRINDKILYYGAFREGRVREFDKYMGRNESRDMFLISAPKAATSKFVERYKFGPDNMLDVLSIPQDLGKFGVTLYMEDDLSHRQFHSPANRFYEALSAKMAILVDRSAVGTLEKAGFQVPDFVITENAADAAAKLENHQRIRGWQHTNWTHCPKHRVPHATALQKELKALLKEVG